MSRSDKYLAEIADATERKAAIVAGVALMGEATAILQTIRVSDPVDSARESIRAALAKVDAMADRMDRAFPASVPVESEPESEPEPAADVPAPPVRVRGARRGASVE